MCDKVDYEPGSCFPFKTIEVADDGEIMIMLVNRVCKYRATLSSSSMLYQTQNGNS